MKLQRIEITNTLGIRQVNIEPKHGAVLVAGANGAGKSSIAEAVRFAVLGVAPRGSGLKKDYPDLLNHDAKAGSIGITFDSAAFTAALPSGKGGSTGEANGALQMTLRPESFAGVTAAERRSFLFNLMGVKATATIVKEKLAARGVDPKRAELVTPLLAAGFDSAMKESQAKARDAKAAWRAITGEAYGSEKGKTWAADVPANPGTDAITVQAAIFDELNASADKISRDLGAIQSEQQACAKREANLVALRAHAERAPGILAKLNNDKGELAELEAKVIAAEEQSSGKKVGTDCECPECGSLLTFDAGKLGARQTETTDVHAAIAALPEYRTARDLMKRVVSTGENAYAAANGAKAAAETLEADQVQPPTVEEIRELSQRLEDIGAKRKEASDKLQALRQAAAAAEAASKTTASAKTHHEDVAAWEVIAEAMAPGGIPAELLADAIAPFNEKLKHFAELAAWHVPSIDDGMVIHFNGHPYAFISESQKWRVDAIIAAAVASISGAGFIMLDRFDVLDSSGRGEALYWLSDIAGQGISSLTFGTMKSVPAGLDALGIHGVWLEEGGVA